MSKRQSEYSDCLLLLLNMIKQNASKILLLSSLLLLFNCNKKEYSKININSPLLVKKEISLNKDELKNWYIKDIELDTIPGISLKRAYDSLLTSKKGKEVIIAVIDTEIDINHKDLKDAIWFNNSEIANNKIDDDRNGYIDDINGWNFIGNLENENIIYSNLECVRVIQKFEKILKSIDSISLKNTSDYKTYLAAKKYYKKILKIALSDQEYANFLYEGYPRAKKKLKGLYPKENYSTKELDSIYNKYKKTDKKLANDAFFLSDFIKYNLSTKWVNNYKKNIDNKINKTLNLNFIDRNKIDKEPENIGNISYGNPNVNNNIKDFYHGTLIAGLISTKVNNQTQSKNKLKIMSLAISSNGEEHDKDIALAIRYAVDNGAKVINMSFGKTFSLHKEWVFDAMMYAEKNNVLIVSSAGNSNLNLNLNNNYYPNDNYNNEPEITNNFLLVGSTSNKVDASLFSNFSNYGNTDVDLFAPGQYIYTTMPKGKYKFDSGTSLASAITSKVAALIYSYYPTLTASQVKHILMDSGLEYTIEVNTPTKKDKKKTTPFNQLSKSGKVLNAYNAFIMADHISK